MSDGTSLPTVKSRFLVVLDGRAGLDGITPTDGGPVKASDLQDDTAAGNYDAIWLGDAHSEPLNIPFTGVPVTFDEVYDLDIVIQSMRKDALAQATARCAALLGEVIGAMAADPSLGYTPTAALPMLEVLPHTWSQVGGWQGKGDEHACRFVLKARVEARLVIT